eukprot:gene38876-47289_t
MTPVYGGGASFRVIGTVEEAHREETVHQEVAEEAEAVAEAGVVADVAVAEEVKIHRARAVQIAKAIDGELLEERTPNQIYKTLDFKVLWRKGPQILPWQGYKERG